METYINNDIGDLQKKVNNLYRLGFRYSLYEYNVLIDNLTKNCEFAATIFVYDHMKNHGIEPNDYTYSLINRLHSKTLHENKRIKLQWDGKTRLQPRRRIHKIMKGHNYSERYNNAKQYTDIVEKYIDENKHILDYGRIKMAKEISKSCNIPFDDVRYVITNLKRTKKIEKNDGIKKLDGYFKVTFS